MGRGIAIEPVPDEFLIEAFTIASNSGALVWRERPKSHFPERAEDQANFNARFTGKAAGFRGPGGQMLVRVQHRGMTRRFVASRLAWRLHTGRWPVGPVEHRNGDDADFSEGNLIEVARGRNRFGGLSLAQRKEADRALVAALAENPDASVAQLSALVGSDQPCVCRRLAKLSQAGLTCGPMCVPSRHWRLTGKGAALAASAKPLVDDLDHDILRVVAQRDHIAAASVAVRIARAEPTAKRRLKALADRGLVFNTDGYSLTEDGRRAAGPLPDKWVKPLKVEGSRKGLVELLLHNANVNRFG